MKTMDPASRCVFIMLCSKCYRLCQVDPSAPVLAAGDPERMNVKKCEELGGIPYHINVINYMVRAARNEVVFWNI